LIRGRKEIFKIIINIKYMGIPRIFSFLHELFFINSKLSVLWLVVRLYVGYEWLMAGYSKFTNPAWVGDNIGAAMTGFVNGALSKTTGAHPDVSGWYAWFLENAVLPYVDIWSYAITYGEILVGLGLIVGLFTFVAAFFGFFMNVNFLLAGTVSTNPVLLLLSLLIMLANRTAGKFGLDGYWARRG